MADRAAAWDQLPAAQRQWLLDHPDAAAGMGGLSEEERAWIREHPDAARTLGEMKPEARDELLERYQSLPPDVQRRLRESPEGYLR
jgi:ABC-type nitrate/sulfonate/bicarbonate transport system substrate-binding protein